MNYVEVKNRTNYWRNLFKGYLQSKKMTRIQEEQIRDYFKKYGKIDITFHEFYFQKNGNFHVNYIPDDLYYCKVDPYFNDWKAAKYIDNKCYYDNWYFHGENIPKTLAKCINGMWMLSQNNDFCFVSIEQVYSYISQQECCVKKATLSEGGQGVYKIMKGISWEEFSKIISSIGGNIIIQEIVQQSEVMSKLNPHSVNTVRVLSFLNRDGDVTIYSSIVRMGIGNSFVDNASSGGITCGIEDSGRLKSVAYAANGNRYDCHPSTGLKFNEVSIPNFDKVLENVKRLHKEFPNFRLLSWDFAIDKNDEPLIIEVNLHYGELDFHQLNNGPLFGNDTYKILDEVYGN